MDYDFKCKCLNDAIRRTGFRLIKTEEGVFRLEDVNDIRCTPIEARTFYYDDVGTLVDNYLYPYINDSICAGIGKMARLEGIAQRHIDNCRSWGYLIDNIDYYPECVRADIKMIEAIYYDQDEMSLFDCDYEEE